MVSLTYLALSNNGLLAGTLPWQLGALTALKHLSAARLRVSAVARASSRPPARGLERGLCR